MIGKKLENYIIKHLLNKPLKTIVMKIRTKTGKIKRTRNGLKGLTLVQLLTYMLHT